MKQLKELRENLGKTVKDLQDLAVRVHKENEGLYTPEAKQQFERMNAERVKLESDIESAEIDNTISGISNNVRSKAENEFARPQYKGTDFYKKDADTALKGWLLRGQKLDTEQHRHAAERVGFDYSDNILSCQMKPSKAVWQQRTGANEGTNSLGGYTVVPDLIASEIDVALKAFCPFRSVCRVYPTATGGQPFLYPAVDDTSVLAVSHSENTADVEQDWTLTQVSVPATTQFSSGIYPISLELLQDSVIPITEVIAELIGTRVGRSMASSFTTTLKSDVTQTSTTASADTCTFADIQALLWAPDFAYLQLPSIGVMASQSWIQNAYSLVDTAGRPILNMSMDAINNTHYQTILGYRLINNNYLSTVAAGNTVAVFGPWERALVRDAGPLNMKVLNERFMDQLAVGVVGYQRSSYKTIRASAFYKQVVHA